MMKYKEDRLMKVLPKEQIEEVFNYERCELGSDFLGFTETYRLLAKLIPKHFMVIDFGCNAAAQCYYFRHHKKYIGVDYDGTPRFHFKNTEHVKMEISEYIAQMAGDMDLSCVFAICNYVPDERAKEAIRERFPNLYIFYPAGGWCFSEFIRGVTK